MDTTIFDLSLPNREDASLIETILYSYILIFPEYFGNNEKINEHRVLIASLVMLPGRYIRTFLKDRLHGDPMDPNVWFKLAEDAGYLVEPQENGEYTNFGTFQEDSSPWITYNAALEGWEIGRAICYGIINHQIISLHPYFAATETPREGQDLSVRNEIIKLFVETEFFGLVPDLKNAVKFRTRCLTNPKVMAKHLQQGKRH